MFAVFIAIAAAFGYLGVARQNAAAKQLTEHDYILQQIANRMQQEFNNSQVCISSYALTGNVTFLRSLRGVREPFARDAATLAALAPASLRPLVIEQEQAGAQLFAVADRISRLPAGSAAARALGAGTAFTASSFYVANGSLQDYLSAEVKRLTEASRHALRVGLAWSAAAIVLAVLLVLAASLSTLRTITRPLRALTVTVRRLTAGDHAARAAVTGSAEVREVAQSVNMQADEADRLRAQEAESNRLRATAREAGLRIREHLAGDEVLREALAAVEHMVEAGLVSLRLIQGDRLGPRVGETRERTLLTDAAVGRVPPGTLRQLHDMFRAQRSVVIDNLRGEKADRLAEFLTPGVLDAMRRSGVVSVLITPFGIGADLLGIITALRTRYGCRFTPAEVDAFESVAADLGRGLTQARLYEAENQLVAKLKGLDKAKSDFFATVSHELRAPLTAIQGYVEMLGDGEAGLITADQRKMLDCVDRNAVRLRSLIDDVFTLAKLESGEATTVMRPVNLAEIIAGAAEAVEPSVAAGQLTLTRVASELELVVEGDAEQLDRVLINLLSNAVKFTPAGGRIEVTAGPDGGSAVVCVADTGIGIPERDQKELFTRFFRASNAREGGISGTGLGLAIVRSIVVNHHGEVELESQQGSGTTVTLRLPLRVPAQEAGDAAARPLSANV